MGCLVGEKLHVKWAELSLAATWVQELCYKI